MQTRFPSPLIIGLLAVFGFVNCHSVFAQLIDQTDVSRFPTGKREEVKLPAEIDEVKVGGNGRYLIFNLRSKQSLAVFDVKTRTLIHKIPIEDTTTLYAAGASKLVILEGSLGRIARYDLQTGERERLRTIRFGASPAKLLMGCNTEGPAFVGTDGGTLYVVDLQSFRVKEFKDWTGDKLRNDQDGIGIGSEPRVSSNGKTLGLFKPFSGILFETDNGWQKTRPDRHEKILRPSPNGKVIYTDVGIYDLNANRIGKRFEKRGFIWPAVNGFAFLRAYREFERFETNEGKKETKINEAVELHLIDDERPLVRIEGLDQIFTRSGTLLQGEPRRGGPGSSDAFEPARDSRGRIKHLRIDDRILLIPSEKVIVQLSPKNDSIVLHDFDFLKAVASTRVKYLHVTSVAPESINVKSEYRYQMDVLTNNSELQWKLESGPEGMTVSPTGLVQWQTDADSSKENDVVVSVVGEEGNAAIHSFQLQVKGGSNAKTRISKREIPPPNENQLAHRPEFPGSESIVELPAYASGTLHAAGGRLMLLRLDSLRKFAVCDVMKGEITGYIPITDPNAIYRAGLFELIAYSKRDSLLLCYDLASCQRINVKKMTFNDAAEGTYVMDIGFGAASDGSALISLGQRGRTSQDFQLLNPRTCETSPALWFKESRGIKANRLETSFNGKRFWSREFGILTLDGEVLHIQYRSSRDDSFLTSHNGNYLFGNSICDFEGKPLGFKTTRSIVPAINSNYFLEYRWDLYEVEPGKKTFCDLRLFGESEILHSIESVEAPVDDSRRYPVTSRPPNIGLQSRVLFAPKLGVMATLSRSNRKVVIRKFDLPKLLKEAKATEKIFVESTAPLIGTPGKKWSYQIEVASPSNDLKYRLESGPVGMQVSASGTVTWVAPIKPENKVERAIVSVSKSQGSETLHSIAIWFPTELNTAESKRRQEVLERQARRQAAIEKKNRIREIARTLVFESRTWRDVSGQHEFTGTFKQIIRKKTVVIVGEDGKEIKVPLSKLGRDEIYEAVRSELKRTGESVPSPFEEK